ncbi:MAG: hypothetical protein JNL63_02445 [Bacteroidia bacterium]|nr:hypothetical protein [Bacteroidia bacterium]
MKYKGKKVAGVWIDHKHAYIISTPDRKNEGTYDVIKKIEVHHHADHSSSENVHHNKEAKELKALYQDVSAQLAADDAIFIIGPGTSQEELKNFLQQNSQFKGKEIELGTADHLSMNEMIAKVRTHFFHN